MHSGMRTTHQTVRRRRLNRQLDAVILHFDYDCFYASVFENENPELRSLPLAVQQKQIVVTCNYEARRRGLYKLQLIRDAKNICPNVVIVLGEDLTRFRDASKDLYLFLRSFSWNQKVERLGFDEVFMDVSDIIDYNLALLNHHDLGNSFFCLSKSDPTAGFSFDASQIAGNTFPEASGAVSVNDSPPNGLRLRLHLGSHLAHHLREALRTQKGFTCTAGVSTNKVLAKLVGNLHKPDNQTTLPPPYEDGGDGLDNVASFIDTHEVRKIPGIGFKLAEKLRNLVLQTRTPEPATENGHEPKQTVLVGDVKRLPAMGPETLEKALGGPGVPHGIGHRVWDLLNGCDDTAVGQARDLPRQISIEDSYRLVDSEAEVIKQLKILSASLLRRMHADLTVPEEEMAEEGQGNVVTESRDTGVKKRWLAFPRTIRLSTRPRAPRSAGGSRYGTPSHRISRSTQMPNFIFSQKEPVTALADRLAVEVLTPLFRKLHPEKTWDLSLINVAATDIADAASEKGGPGRDIKNMFKRQDDVLKQWRVEETTGHALVEKEEVIEKSIPMVSTGIPPLARTGSEDLPTRSQEETADDEWDDGDEDMLDEDIFRCELCGSAMPLFALAAHERWHERSG